MEPTERLEKVKEDYKQGKQLDLYGFWGDRMDSPEESTFSNFHRSYFKDSVITDIPSGKKGLVTFSSSEQYFMYVKAYHFKDNATMKKILKPGYEAHDYKRFGREVKNYNDEAWNKVRFDAMKQACRLKYTQNPDLRTILLNTEDAILVEASPYDKIWGVGLAKFSGSYMKPDSTWKNPLKWRGLNLLGFALMDVREELKK